MPEIDVESSVRGGTVSDQQRHGTLQENFAKLRRQFSALVEAGADSPDVYRSSMETLLHSFETIRTQQEAHIKDYEKKIAYCRAMQEAASMFSSTLIGILVMKVRDARGDTLLNSASGTVRKRDIDVVGKEICICGCQDEEDSSDCKCECHGSKGFCQNPQCYFCKKVAEDKAKKKAPSKKRSTKKSSRKK